MEAWRKPYSRSYAGPAPIATLRCANRTRAIIPTAQLTRSHNDPSSLTATRVFLCPQPLNITLRMPYGVAIAILPSQCKGSKMTHFANHTRVVMKIPPAQCKDSPTQYLI